MGSRKVKQKILPGKLIRNLDTAADCAWWDAVDKAAKLAIKILDDNGNDYAND